MKITIVTYEMELEGGGLAYSCHQFRDMLTELGNEVNMISSALNDEKYIKGGYDKNLNRSLAYETKLKNASSSLSTDTLLIAFGGGFNGYYASLLAEKVNCKMWLMLRGSDANICKWEAEKAYYTSYAIKYSELTICLSKEICTNARNLVPGCNTVVIPNACHSLIDEIQPFTKGKLVIGTGATHLNEKKGVMNLICMIGLFTQQHSDFDLTLELVGEIDNDILEQYKQQCECVGIRNKVQFAGRKSREEFRVMQSKWDVYVQASVCEGMGNSVVDCMSLGIPVVLSDTGYVAELANQYMPEIVSPLSDAQSLSDTLFKVLCNESNTQKYKTFYEEFFRQTNIEIIKAKWQELFRGNINNVKSTIPEGILSVSLHDVSGDKHDNITTPVKVFKKFVDDIHKAGYVLCSMKDYLDRSPEQRSNCIVCTFDDGYIGLLNNAMPIMRVYGFTATVYICTDYIGKCNDWNFKDKQRRFHLNIEELHELCNAGWEIGSHGVSHRSLLRLSDEEVMYELSISKRILEKEFGPVTSYAYPYGDYNDYIMKFVKQFYGNAFLLTQGGVFLEVDSYRIHRYYVSEIYKIIKGL